MASSTVLDRLKSFLVRIIFPTAVTIVLFVTSIFWIIIPTIEKNSLDRKREMIRELTNSAWNILAKLENDEKQGLLGRAQAQRQAIDQIRNLHYGQQMKDYFWINDMHPRMVIHPYRSDLNGTDLTDYVDPNGTQVFVECVKVVKASGAGYVQYMWQWKDDEARIVPKISYVKGFAPWGWIIGTGIYIDDVRAEIAVLKRNLIEISLFILVVISILLAGIAWQNYTTLQRQLQAEQALRDSEEKYRLLVESAGEGMLMALEGTYRYANQTVADLLGYSPGELTRMRLFEIFADAADHPGDRSVQELISGKSIPETFETRLKTKAGQLLDVILSTTQISIGGEDGFIAVVTDITKRKQAEDALGESEEKFRTMAYNLNVAIFRRTIGKKPRFIEVNPAMVELLGFEGKEELQAYPLADLFVDPEDQKKLGIRTRDGSLSREVLKLRRKDGTIFSASIWSVTVMGEDATPLYYDGIVEDVSDLQAREEERSALLADMQNALFFLNQPISSLAVSKVVTCSESATARDAAGLLKESPAGIILAMDAQGNCSGTVTDQDVSRQVVGAQLSQETPVSRFMSSPVITIAAGACIFEAGQLMEQEQISHLVVTGTSGALAGVIRMRDVSSIQKYSPAVLLTEIHNAVVPEDLFKQKAVKALLLSSLIASGAAPRYVTHLTTVITDTLLQKLIGFAVTELGLPPVRFSFLIFGSEGRNEQTLRTDQDNAIVYEDPLPEMAGAVHEYFMQMGRMVCGWLDGAGYAYCDGDNMAQNQKWCQPLATWKKYFTAWISTADAEDLLQAKIFFDFRNGYGEQELTDELRMHLAEVIVKHPRF
ncbi:MAG: PAS domain S-box protein, partial [Deltaproteobacteria bacterium]|nr:PAS domain S-box protein [Deltaproteobacteria bacterium]